MKAKAEKLKESEINEMQLRRNREERKSING